MTAPAPIKSSSAGRRLPSGQRSPAAITATGPPSARARAATALALRRQPASTVPRDAASKESADPFGDGSTIRAPAGIEASADGEIR